MSHATCPPAPLRRARFLSVSLLALVATFAQAADEESSVEIGSTLDLGSASRELALPARQNGLSVKHADVVVDARLGRWFDARLTGVAHQAGHALETDVEEAWLETKTLPAGWSVRAGRFLPQTGYLNEQHPHADDFVDRPLLYRAFLGGHYYDDGLRLNWVAPTSTYWRIGAELLNGGKLSPENQRNRAAAWTLGTRVGADWDRSNSWQLGLSHLSNRSYALADHAGETEEEHAGHSGHAGHGALYGGRRMSIAEAVWKWAPDGNNRSRQLKLSTEYARVDGLGDQAQAGDRHSSWYLSAVYRFAPEWEAGVRHGDLRVRTWHEEEGGFEGGRLAESSLALAWKPNHKSALRLQFTRQQDRGGFAEAKRALMLQYVVSLGAHGAHGY